jgi:predicted nuclease of predicted toxin-antitoxin system
VWAAAQNDGRFLITQDLDFSDVRKYQPGSHCGLLLVRMRNAGRATLIRALVALFTNEEVSSWARCFVVLSEHKLRVSRPRR